MTDKSIELYNELLAEIGITLETCDSTMTPKVCEYRSTPQNFEALRRNIAQRVMTGKTIYQATLDIEKEFGQTYMED
jgi:hypothetical protein